MKKNLTKLALSGVALAAVAATLGTSTYAWYTTNPTVSANNIVGASSDTGSSSIFISKDSEADKDWSASVTFGVTEFASASMLPLQYANAGKFTQIDASGETLAKTAAAPAGTNAVEITLYFRSSRVNEGNEQAIYLKDITLENTTGLSDTVTTPVLPKADNLLKGQGKTTVGVSSDKATYAVDFRNALSMAVYNADTTDRYAVAAVTSTTFATLKANLFTYTAATSSTSASYDALPETATFNASTTYYTKVKGYDKAFSIGMLKDGTTPETGAGQTIDDSTAKAQEYYNEVMEKDLTADLKTAAGSYDKAPIAVCPANGEDYATVKFYVYLDGASQYCYDACQGQTFKMNLTFTSESKSAWNNA